VTREQDQALVDMATAYNMLALRGDPALAARADELATSALPEVEAALRRLRAEQPQPVPGQLTVDEVLVCRD
jgi:hypothetical protein